MCLLCCHFFFSFYFLNALQSDINSNRVYVLGHKYVLGPSQTHFSLSQAQNIFMPANINSIVILYIYMYIHIYNLFLFSLFQRVKWNLKKHTICGNRKLMSCDISRKQKVQGKQNFSPSFLMAMTRAYI